MASAKKCDRCGKLYERYNEKRDRDNINGILTLNMDANQQYYSHKVIDFCPDCKDSFQKWLLFDEITVEDLKEDTNE